METINNRQEKEGYWRNQMVACEESKPSKVAYAKSQGLSYGRFLYWIHKLMKSQESEALTKWLPIKVSAPSHVPILASIKMENGYSLDIHDIQTIVYLLKKKR